jgi:putative DNA primase/helicase
MPEVVYAAALAYRRAGCSLIPVAADGTKRPAAWLLPKIWDQYARRWKPTWKPLQSYLPTEADLRRWFAKRPVGLALIGGRISGGLEILDFDALDIFGPWCQMVEALCPGFFGQLPVTQTPDDGRHLFYRCEGVDGNLKLAQRLGLHGQIETLIETRGEGGYAIVPPSQPACHPSNRPYVLLQGDLATIPVITPDERTALLHVARTFNAYIPAERVVLGPRATASQPTTGDRPGDLFNRHATWSELLESHGWSRVGQRGEVTLWKRSGKQGPGTSATTNYAGRDLLFVFSASAHPFEPETAYDKFAAYTLLEHHGDFQAAARLLALKGYRRSRPGERLPPLHDPWLGPRWRLHGVPLAVRRMGVEVRHGA